MDSFDDPSEMTPEQRQAELANTFASAFEPRGFPRFLPAISTLPRNEWMGPGAHGSMSTRFDTARCELREDGVPTRWLAVPGATGGGGIAESGADNGQPGTPVAYLFATGTARRFLHEDFIGSVRFLTDDQGEVVESRDYLPFGEEISVEGSVPSGLDESEIGFAGKRAEGSVGELRFGARWNDARLGRFGSIDRLLLGPPPIGHLASPQLLHPYSYAAANPLSFSDATGDSTDTEGHVDPSLVAGGAAFGFGDALLYAVENENNTTKGGFLRLGKPAPGMHNDWAWSFHLDFSKKQGAHFNADFGPLTRYDHKPVPRALSAAATTNAARTLARSTVALGIALDAFSLATADPSDYGMVVGGIVGGWAGGAVGAAVGSALLPGPGTVVGGLVGGVGGGLAGQYGGQYVDQRR